MSMARLISTAPLCLTLLAMACSSSSSGGANGGNSNPSQGGSTNGGSTTASGGSTLGGQQGLGGASATSGGSAPKGGSTSGGSTSTSGGSTGALGGSTSAGTTGTAGSGTAGSAGSGPLGGYHVKGDWAGFAFVYADGGATITPDKETGFKTMTDKDGPYCAKGSILGTADYSSSAAIGFNTKQEKIQDAPSGKVVPSGTGLLVNISNPGKSASLRVQIEDGTDPKSAEAPKHRWCVNISDFDKDIVIPWASFNTECWSGGKGTAFDPTTPLAKALVFLPSDGKTTLQFDFCVNKIGPDTATGRGTGTLGTSCGNSVTWAKTSTNVEFDNIASGDGKYHFQSNNWGWSKASVQKNQGQTNSLLAACGFKVDQQTCVASASEPCSFPSVYVGQSADGKPTSGNGLPKQVSAITSVPTCLGWSSGGTPASDEYNVSYDVWFNSSSGATNADVFLMVWFRKPPTFQPAGSPKADGVLIAGQPWNVWYGPNAAGQNVVTYLAPTAFADGKSFSFDLKDFMADAVERKYLDSSKYLISVMGGMEIWTGAQGAAITDYKTEVK